MKKLALALLAFTLCVASASAQDVTNPSPPQSINGAYNATPPTCVDGHGCWFQTDVNGKLLTSGSASISGTTSNASSGVATSSINIPAVSYLYVWNGTTWDQLKGDTTNGAFVNVKTSVLPTGAATAALQSTINTTLGTPFQAGGNIGNTTFASTQSGTWTVQPGNIANTTAWKVDGSAVTQPISAASLPLPSGAGTAANQIATQAPVTPATATATKSDLVGCQATTAAVNPTTGQQGTINCDTNNNILTSSGGAPNLTIAQVSIATTDTLAIAARALRRAVTLQNITGTQQVYCNQTTATTANGVLLPAVIGASITLNTTSAVRCIAVTGAQTIAVVETY